MQGAGFTLGVEEEYQLVDRETGELRGRAPELVVPGGPATEEFQRTMAEVATPICRSAAEAADRVAERRRALLDLAEARGLTLAAAGIHPVGPFPRAQVSDDANYRRIAAKGGTPAKEMHVFGLHIHVAVPDREAATRAMTGATPFIPHLLCLTASSPFDRGEDTAFCSFRTLVRDMSPRVGPPLPVATAPEYDRIVEILSGERRRAKLPTSPISWDIRPSENYPTLEFRFTDVCPWLDTTRLVTALARALTVMYADRPAPQVSAVEQQLIRENRWRAARYGLDAEIYRLDPPTGETVPIRDAIRMLIERLAPIAERLGDGDVLARAESVLERGNPAARMREIFQDTGSFPDVVRWVVDETTSMTR